MKFPKSKKRGEKCFKDAEKLMKCILKCKVFSQQICRFFKQCVSSRIWSVLGLGQHKVEQYSPRPVVLFIPMKIF